MFCHEPSIGGQQQHQRPTHSLTDHVTQLSLLPVCWAHLQHPLTAFQWRWTHRLDLHATVPHTVLKDGGVHWLHLEAREKQQVTVA